ncbi:MAG TPA: FecR domain-containing protein, partial [Parapedobacter sp.]|nr:FecR domain-containing protein [Parapedobacter sp.]
MKKTEEFDGVTVHGLIADDDFIQWVNNPNETLDHQWKLVCDRDDANARIIAEARALVKAVNIQADLPPRNAKERVFERIKSEIKENVEEQPALRSLWQRPLFRAAAVVLLVSVVGLWFYLGQERTFVPLPNAPLSVNNGVIYLNDGRTLPFSDLEEGVASVFGAAVITIEPGNRLVYQATNGLIGTTDVSGLRTPAGAVWEVQLPDGSKASLNAQSSLRFASDNFGDQRRVSLGGEAYFEVAHDVGKPFVVEAGEVEVTVLGTDFMVSGYEPSETVNVALVDGSVQVKHELGNAVV